MTKIARLLTILLMLAATISIGSLTVGAAATYPANAESGDSPAAEADSSPSVTCIPLGLYGDITTPPLVGRLSDGGDNLTFVGTSNGLYVVAPGGKLQHFLYSPFGIKHVALIDDVTDDGIREVVVALNDTQVPALRCYDGATWERLWQFAPMAKVWDGLWIKRQLAISNLAVIEARGSQSIVITSGRRVFSVDAKEGTAHKWLRASSALRCMVTLADLNGNGADEVFVGSDDGHLYLLSGKTGKTLWRTKLPERKGADYDVTTPLASDIVVMDREHGKVAVASADGWLQMYDLAKETLEWRINVFDESTTEGYSSSEDLLLSPTADITGDGLPEVLVTQKPSGGYTYTDEKGALCDSTGNVLWHRDALACSPVGVETGSFEGKPVFLQGGEDKISLVDLKDGGVVLHTIPLSALMDPGLIVTQPGGDGYLSFSSGSDLVAISAKGDLLWYYPRLSSVTAISGAFVGEDVLLCGEWSSNEDSYVPAATKVGMTVGNAATGEAPAVRLLGMMNGATRDMVWSYEVPYELFKNDGGLMGIQVIPDLAGGDGIPDIMGYREDTVTIFSGKDGNPLTFQVGEPIASLDIFRNGASGNAIAVGIAGGLMLFDGAGTQLWSTTSAEWSKNGSASFMVLDDINSDNISDLAVISASRILVLKSTDTASHLELHQTFDAETDSSIEYVEAIPDADGDGVGDLAYIQREKSNQKPGQYTAPKYPVLMERSLADGEKLIEVQMPDANPAIDLACGDFDGDGHSDSLVGYSQQGLTHLLVLSGKKGDTLGSYVLTLGQQYRGLEGGWNDRRLPAIDAGNLNGDSDDDLVYGYVQINAIQSYTRIRSRLLTWDVAHRKSLNDILTSPSFQEKGRYNGNSPTTLRTLTDANGHHEVIAGIPEPPIPSCDPDAQPDYGGSCPQCLAVVDMESGQRLAGFVGFDPDRISLFESHQPGVLGMAACGGVYLLNTSSDLNVTSPENGAKKRPTITVKWEGSADGDFSQVYVDGARNRMSNGSKAHLYLPSGEYTAVVRSVDDCGRIFYSPSDLGSPLIITVTPSPWKPVLLVLSLFAFAAFVVLLFYARLHRMWRARKRAAKGAM